MIASLLHANCLLPDPPSSSPLPPSFVPNNQLLPDGPKEKSKPRQVRLQAAFKNHSNAKLITNDAPRPHQVKQKRIPSATLVVAPASLLNQWGEELKRCSKEGTIDVHIWHGQNRFSLPEALYPDEIEYIDDDDEQDIESSDSDEANEDIIMVDQPESGAEQDDDGEWQPKARSRRVTKVQTKKDKKKKIQVVVTSYGVLSSEHAKYERSIRKSESSVFGSTFTFPGTSRLLIVVTSRMASCCSG